MGNTASRLKQRFSIISLGATLHAVRAGKIERIFGILSGTTKGFAILRQAAYRWKVEHRRKIGTNGFCRYARNYEFRRISAVTATFSFLLPSSAGRSTEVLLCERHI